jgi:hypothetical protein
MKFLKFFLKSSFLKIKVYSYKTFFGPFVLNKDFIQMKSYSIATISPQIIRTIFWVYPNCADLWSFFPPKLDKFEFAWIGYRRIRVKFCFNGKYIRESGTIRVNPKKFPNSWEIIMYSTSTVKQKVILLDFGALNLPHVGLKPEIKKMRGAKKLF